MLVLSRKVGEEVLVDDGQIRIRVIRISQNRVAIGIDAPVDVSVLRAELDFDRESELAFCCSNKDMGEPHVSSVA